jgi:hypothetical protein
LLLRIAPKDRETDRLRKFAEGRDCLLAGNYTERDVEKKVEMVEVVVVVVVEVVVVEVVVEVVVVDMTMTIFKMNAKIVPLVIMITTMMMKKVNSDLGTVPLVECMRLEGETSTYHPCNFHNNN